MSWPDSPPTGFGVGDAFGKAADAVIRRPAPAVLPLLLDIAVFLVGLVVLAGFGVDVLQGPAYARVHFGFGLPAALPSLADVLNLAVVASGLGAPTLATVAAFAVVLVPVAAYLEAGFVAVLRAAYLDEGEDEDRPLFDLLVEGGRRGFGRFLLYRLVLTAGFVVTLALAAQGGAWANSAAGALALRWLLMFTPYAMGDGLGFVDGVRSSMRTVSDHLATSLVVLLFLLLTTGGVAAVLTPFVHNYGVYAILAGIALYAPVGTALSTFVLIMWRHLNRVEAEPESLPARETAAPARA